MQKRTGALSVVALISLLVPHGMQAVSVPLTFTSFIDVSTSAWYATYVQGAASLGIVSGYKDASGNPTGMFGPERQVTLGEVLKIAIESAGYDSTRGRGYGHWAASYLSIAIGENFAVALEQSINLDRPATRAEVASLVADAFKVRTVIPAQAVFSDVLSTTPYALSIQSLAEGGVISGDTDATGRLTGTFRPNDAVKRAEVVKIVMESRTKYGLPGRGASSSSVSSSSSSQTSSTSSSSSSACSIPQCGYAPAVPNWLCGDGSLGGPSCEKLPDGRCGWLIRQCPSQSSSSVSSIGQTFNVLYLPTGFYPSIIRIRAGDSIAFKNERSGIGMWVASNPYPTHNEYPAFDAKAASATGSTFTFTFSRNGVFGYHNHLRPQHQATVIVEQ